MEGAEGVWECVKPFNLAVCSLPCHWQGRVLQTEQLGKPALLYECLQGSSVNANSRDSKKLLDRPAGSLGLPHGARDWILHFPFSSIYSFSSSPLFLSLPSSPSFLVFLSFCHGPPNSTTVIPKTVCKWLLRLCPKETSFTGASD